VFEVKDSVREHRVFALIVVSVVLLILAAMVLTGKG
jgi:hypothetical protein